MTSPPLDCYQMILLGDRGTCVNNLPKVVTWKWNGQESNPRPFVSRANTLTITPPGHTHTSLPPVNCSTRLVHWWQNSVAAGCLCPRYRQQACIGMLGTVKYVYTGGQGGPGGCPPIFLRSGIKPAQRPECRCRLPHWLPKLVSAKGNFRQFQSSGHCSNTH